MNQADVPSSTPEQPSFTPMTEPVVYPQPPQKTPNSRKKWLYIAGGAILLVVIAVVTVYLISRFTSDTEPDQRQSYTLTELATKLGEKYPQPETNIEVREASATRSAVKNIDGHWIGVDVGSDVLFVDSQTAELDAFSRTMKDFAFEQVEQTNKNVRYFTSDSQVCAAYYVTQDDEEPAKLLRAYCAEDSSFTNTDIRVELAGVYAKAAASDESLLPADRSIFLTIDVQDSATEDYRNARVNVSAFDMFGTFEVARFYQTPDDTWHFFSLAVEGKTQPCTDYAGDDIVNAYIGFTCLDDAGNNAFVERQAPVFEIEPGAQG